MTYLIIDWMYRVCFDSDSEGFEDFDSACEFLDRRIEEELDQDGLNPYGNGVDVPAGYIRNATDEDYSEYIGEYEIVEYHEGIDRLMWDGMRYVFKPNYYGG